MSVPVASNFFRYPSTAGLRVALQHIAKQPHIGRQILTGTVKIHGTNAAIAYHRDGSWFCQSRNRPITLESDNYEFCQFVHTLGPTTIQSLFRSVRNVIASRAGVEEDVVGEVVVFGEFAGHGIQDVVAVNGVPRFWSIFGVQYFNNGKEQWLSLDDIRGIHVIEQKVFNVMQFETFSVDVDFSSKDAVISDDVVAKLVSFTLEVEECCPVGKYFGVTGLGEGIVWSTNDRSVIFKTKGNKHRKTSELLLNEVGGDPERVFARTLVPHGRLQQGLEYMREMNHALDLENASIFLQWIQGDIEKEDRDLIEQSEFAKGDKFELLQKAITTRASIWYAAVLANQKPLEPTIVQPIDFFVQTLVTDIRLQKGLEYMHENSLEINMKNIKQFIRYIRNMVDKEESAQLDASEFADTAEKRKEVLQKVCSYAASWYRDNN
jgi:hypothetical protein